MAFQSKYTGSQIESILGNERKKIVATITISKDNLSDLTSNDFESPTSFESTDDSKDFKTLVTKLSNTSNLGILSLNLLLNNSRFNCPCLISRKDLVISEGVLSQIKVSILVNDEDNKLVEFGITKSQNQEIVGELNILVLVDSQSIRYFTNYNDVSTYQDLIKQITISPVNFTIHGIGTWDFIEFELYELSNGSLTKININKTSGTYIYLSKSEATSPYRMSIGHISWNTSNNKYFGQIVAAIHVDQQKIKIFGLISKI